MKVVLTHGAFHLPIESTQFTKSIHSSWFLTEDIPICIEGRPPHTVNILSDHDCAPFPRRVHVFNLKVDFPIRRSIFQSRVNLLESKIHLLHWASIMPSWETRTCLWKLHPFRRRVYPYHRGRDEFLINGLRIVRFRLAFNEKVIGKTLATLSALRVHSNAKHPRLCLYFKKRW